MGLSAAVIGAIGLGLSAAGTALSFVQQQRAQRQARSQAREAREASEEANAVRSANERARQAAARRRAVREQRVVTAQLQQGAQNVGIGASSGALAAPSVVGTNLGTNLAEARGTRLAVQGISAANQRIANAARPIQQTSPFGSLLSAAGGFVQGGGLNIFSAFGGLGGGGVGGTIQAPSGQTRGTAFGLIGGGV